MGEHSIALSRRKFIALSALTGATVTTSSLINPLQAHAITAAEKQAEAAATLDKLNSLNNKLDAASGELIAAREEQQAAKDRMDEAQRNIDDATARIGDLQEQLGTRARSMYRSGSSSFIDMLLGATSFKAFTNNWGILNNMNENDAEMVQETKDLRVKVQEEKTVYEEQEKVAAEKAEAAEAVQAEAQALVDQVQATYDSLSSEAAQLLEAERSSREQASAAQAQNEIRQLQSGGGSTSNKKYYNDKVPTVTGNIIIDRAMNVMNQGIPYEFGAGGPNSFDCSGFVGYCCTGGYGHALGGTGSIINMTPISDPRPGDIAVVHIEGGRQHCGIYIGNAQMIHAPHTGANVGYGSTAGMSFVRY